MAIMTVPVIYDRATKKILRWYILDAEYQLYDRAFNPQSSNESLFRIPYSTYRLLAGGDQSKPLLSKLQEHINGNAP